MYLVIRLVHKNLRKSHMKNLKVCIASSVLAAALALAPASALAEGTTLAPTSTTGATATTGITPIPAPTKKQLTDPTTNPYAPEDAYFMRDITRPIPEGFMVGNADGETIIDNGDGTVTVKGHWESRLKKWCKAISLLPSNLHYATSLQTLKSLSITCKRWSMLSCVHASL